ncbi:Tetratricopeptide TPR_1 repeat-containing protein [Cyanobacterium stanieri PCC 7202]|uniref:Tetratricopeptide TPR_1 repeat-containing protein n=1 Tax=Cyanobacterium stanieri (strain ATCC 29140 / PCC 7202) TaxID=292563 RepID=K9YR22_CYASC|nr:Tetratricopeptide TPR_1 repeat-containing protein [Cyanobacterium stanieri PCC 7202]
MDNWSEIKEQIKAFCNQNNYEQLKIYIESLLAENDSNALLLAYAGVSYMLANEEEKAISLWLDCFLCADEEELIIAATNLQELGDLYFKNNQFNTASLIYQQVLEFNAEYFQCYLSLGYCFLYSGNFDDAMEVWKNGLSINDQWKELYLNIAEQYQYIREYNQAISYYLKALDFYTNDSKILYNLGFCYTATDQLDLAIGYYQQCLNIDPNNCNIYGELGYIYLLQGNIKKAKEYWQILVNINPDIFNNLLNWSKESNDQSIILNYRLIDNLFFNKSLAEFTLIIANLLFAQKKYSLASIYYQISLNELVLKQNNLLNQNLLTTNEIKNILHNLFFILHQQNDQDKVKEYLNQLSNTDNEYIKNVINHLINSPTKKVNHPENLIINEAKKYYETSQQWADTKRNYQLIYGDNQLNLKPPQSFDDNIHPSFYFPHKFSLPPSFVTILDNGRFWLREDEGSSAIISDDNYMIGDISPESPALSPNHPDKHPRYHSLLTTSSLPPVTRLEGKVVVLGGLLNNIYFHWLFDILPCIHLLEKASITWDEVDYVVVDNRCSFQRETLEMFGIPSSKILPLSFPTHIKADKLIVPSFPSAIAWMPPWSCQYLRTKILGDNLDKKTPHKRIYISREKSSNRRLINEQEIISILEEYDFDILNLELFSVKQQAELLNQAEIVISPHGSGLSNLVFCQSNTKVIEIFSPNYVYPCYWLVSNIIDLEYHYILGEIMGSKSFDNFLYPDSRFEDIYINPDDLRTNLEQILSS